MNIVSVGIDLGKVTFHLVALDDHGKVVVRKKFSRNHLLAYTANLQSSMIGIKACAGARSQLSPCSQGAYHMRLEVAGNGWSGEQW